MKSTGMKTVVMSCLMVLAVLLCHAGGAREGGVAGRQGRAEAEGEPLSVIDALLCATSSCGRTPPALTTAENNPIRASDPMNWLRNTGKTAVGDEKARPASKRIPCMSPMAKLNRTCSG